jgi:rhamnosyl/mannosyltransferase
MPAFEPFFHRAVRRASAVIASSRRYAETSAFLRRYEDRCRIIPYGIDVERFSKPAELLVADLRRRYGPRIVLAVGRLIYYKGFDFLIRAMRSVDGALVIVGNGPLRASLESVARSCGVEDRVTFVAGASDRELVSYYHAADVFVLPSTARSEAFGIVQIEAMASGRAVVNTNLDSGVPSVSLDGVTGITVPPANADALASAITTLLDDPGRRAIYGDTGRRRAREEFNVDVMARRTLDVYREAMRKA